MRQQKNVKSTNAALPWNPKEETGLVSWFYLWGVLPPGIFTVDTIDVVNTRARNGNLCYVDTFVDI